MREIEIELYWKARTALILGQILKPKTTLILGRREYVTRPCHLLDSLACLQTNDGGMFVHKHCTFFSYFDCSKIHLFHFLFLPVLPSRLMMNYNRPRHGGGRSKTGGRPGNVKGTKLKWPLTPNLIRREGAISVFLLCRARILVLQIGPVIRST